MDWVLLVIPAQVVHQALVGIVELVQVGIVEPQDKVDILAPVALQEQVDILELVVLVDTQEHPVQVVILELADIVELDYRVILESVGQVRVGTPELVVSPQAGTVVLVVSPQVGTVVSVVCLVLVVVKADTQESVVNRLVVIVVFLEHQAQVVTLELVRVDIPALVRVDTLAR